MCTGLSITVFVIIMLVVLVYCPIAHSVWHPDGFLFKAGVLDFAGGNVVHVSSGIAGLVSTIVVGNRHGFGSEVCTVSDVIKIQYEYSVTKVLIRSMLHVCKYRCSSPTAFC
jgi:ammonia channel protein AmtB